MFENFRFESLNLFVRSREHQSPSFDSLHSSGISLLSSCQPSLPRGPSSGLARSNTLGCCSVSSEIGLILSLTDISAGFYIPQEYFPEEESQTVNTRLNVGSGCRLICRRIGIEC